MQGRILTDDLSAKLTANLCLLQERFYVVFKESRGSFELEHSVK